MLFRTRILTLILSSLIVDFVFHNLHKIKLTLVLFGLITGVYAQANDTILIKNVNVIPMDKEIVLNNQNVVIAGDKIISIEPYKREMNHISHQVIDGAGKYVMPGFSEMHYHWRNKQGGIDRDFKLLVANGVTTVRNMAEYNWQNHVAIRDSISKGEKFGPNYYTAGPYLNSNDLKTIEDAISIINNHKIKGYDYLKLADNLPKDVYLKVLEEAQKQGVVVIGHAQRGMPLEMSLRMRSIEHVEEFVYVFSHTQRNDSLFLKQAIEQIKVSGSNIVPTLVVFDFIVKCLDDQTFIKLNESESAQYMLPSDFKYWYSDENPYRKNLKGTIRNGVDALTRLEGYFKWMKTFTKMLADADVPLMTGSDTFGFVVPGFSLHEEFQFLDECGLTPFEILKASTITPARYLNTIATEGTVSEGKHANLVLLGKNPLEDIKNTQTIEGVVLKGMWYDRNNLNTLLKEIFIK
ncbi:amidohydrolase family protein [Gaetbulibacter sp. M235]|uniref:amidohydrolase family protein n=1 Tax=Gaetbulibacter sp. M235 TaxID=3126510 RepID=UPI00374FCF4A